MPTTIPIKDANGNTVNMVVNPAYDSQDDMVKMKSVQKKWRDSFTVVGPPDVAKWDTSLGTGGAASIVTAGVLRMVNGSTTANAETTVTSKETFTIPFRVSVGFTLSQRILNSTFFIEAISVNPSTGNPDGLHSLAWAFEGNANPTQGIYEVQNGGLARFRSPQSTVVTTASGGVYELEAFADEAWFHSATLDAATGRANSYRRHQQIPDPNAVYKVRLRWLNGASAPASSTNADIQYLSVQDYAELTAEITAGRGNSVAGNAMSVMLAGAAAATTPIGSAQVVGPAAHDAARGSTAPVITAARALSANYTTVATGDVADLITTLQGILITRPWQIPEQEWSYVGDAAGITTTADVTLAGAAGAGLRRYLTSIQLSNDSATATDFLIKDGATNPLWRVRLPANCPNFSVEFANPLRSPANATLVVACSATGKVHLNAQGYTAP